MIELLGARPTQASSSKQPAAQSPVASKLPACVTQVHLHSSPSDTELISDLTMTPARTDPPHDRPLLS
jgi:hypothetical protein